MVQRGIGTTGNLNFIKDSLWPYLTPVSATLATLTNLLNLTVLIEWATNSLCFSRLNTEFIPMTPTTALRFFLLNAVLLCQQRRSIIYFKPGNAYEAEGQLHAARCKNKPSFISMARWEGIR